MSTRNDLKQGLEAFAEYFTPLQTQPIALAVAIDLILDALAPEAEPDAPSVHGMGFDDPIKQYDFVRAAKRDAWQEGYQGLVAVVPDKDPTTSDKPEYFLWIGRGKDGPSVTFERLLKDDYLMAASNPLRFAPNASWRGRRLRVTFTDVTDGEAKAPESWIEERAALLAENARLRQATTWKPGAALVRDVEEAHQWRREAAAAVGLSIESGWPDLLARITRGAEALRASVAGATTYQWQEWARSIVGGGINLAPLDLFERAKEEVATLLETNRTNERKAMRALKVLVDYRRLTEERGKIGPFHESESVKALDLLSRLEYEQLGPRYGT